MDLEFDAKCGHKFHALNLDIELNDNISIRYIKRKILIINRFQYYIYDGTIYR